MRACAYACGWLGVQLQSRAIEAMKCCQSVNSAAKPTACSGTSSTCATTTTPISNLVRISIALLGCAAVTRRMCTSGDDQLLYLLATFVAVNIVLFLRVHELQALLASRNIELQTLLAATGKSGSATVHTAVQTPATCPYSPLPSALPLPPTAWLQPLQQLGHIRALALGTKQLVAANTAAQVVVQGTRLETDEWRRVSRLLKLPKLPKLPKLLMLNDGRSSEKLEEMLEAESVSESEDEALIVETLPASDRDAPGTWATIRRRSGFVFDEIADTARPSNLEGKQASSGESASRQEGDGEDGNRFGHWTFALKLASNLTARVAVAGCMVGVGAAILLAALAAGSSGDSTTTPEAATDTGPPKWLVLDMPLPPPFPLGPPPPADELSRPLSPPAHRQSASTPECIFDPTPTTADGCAACAYAFVESDGEYFCTNCTLQGRIIRDYMTSVINPRPYCFAGEPVASSAIGCEECKGAWVGFFMYASMEYVCMLYGLGGQLLTDENVRYAYEFGRASNGHDLACWKGQRLRALPPPPPRPPPSPEPPPPPRIVADNGVAGPLMVGSALGGALLAGAALMAYRRLRRKRRHLRRLFGLSPSRSDLLLGALEEVSLGFGQPQLLPLATPDATPIITPNGTPPQSESSVAGASIPGQPPSMASMATEHQPSLVMVAVCAAGDAAAGGFAAAQAPKHKSALTVAPCATVAVQEISPSEIALRSRLGTGGWGVVYKARWLQSEVAVKVLKPSTNAAGTTSRVRAPHGPPTCPHHHPQRTVPPSPPAFPLPPSPSLLPPTFAAPPPLPEQKEKTGAMMGALRAEAILLAKLRHPCICAFYGMTHLNDS